MSKLSRLMSKNLVLLVTRKPRFLYFVAGLALAGSCFFASFYWMEIIWAFQEPDLGFDRQPLWFHVIGNVIDWLPWAALAAVVVLGYLKGPRIEVGFYFLGTIAPWVFFFGYMFFGDTVADWLHRQPFDAETWRNQDSIEHDVMWPLRLCMVDDLMSSGGLDGLTRSQVVELLGPPEDKGFRYFDKYCDIYIYCLGPERGFMRMDSEWLLITFGDDDKVNRYWLGRD